MAIIAPDIFKAQLTFIQSYLELAPNEKENVAKRLDSLKDFLPAVIHIKHKLRDSYAKEIESEFEVVKTIYALASSPFLGNLYLPVLDGCRKILELLIRFDLELSEKEGVHKSHIGQVKCWDDVQKTLAKKIYEETSHSVHTRTKSLLNKSKDYSDDAHLDVLRKQLRENANRFNQSISDEEIEEHVEHARGLKGLDPYVCKIINDTMDLTNAVLQHYSKPFEGLPQDSKPPAP